MPAPLRVLTVGDGDLSYSLALQRAFGNAIQLTATVLPTEDELAATYTMAAANAAELRSRGATVLYGIDATALAPSLGPLEAVVSPSGGCGEASTSCDSLSLSVRLTQWASAL